MANFPTVSALGRMSSRAGATALLLSAIPGARDAAAQNSTGGQSGAAAASPVGITIECPSPLNVVTNETCVGTVQPADSPQTKVIRIRVREASSAVGVVANVRFRASAGTLVPDTATTDAQGYASTFWFRGRSTEPAGIVVEARVPAAAAGAPAVAGAPATATAPAATAVRYIELTPAPPEHRYGLDLWSGSGQAWFEKSQLRYPVVVEVVQIDRVSNREVPVTNPAVCAAQRVAFTKIGSTGMQSPDTVAAALSKAPDDSAAPPEAQTPLRRRGDVAAVAQDEPRPEEDPKLRDGCFAETYWTLGDNPGDRHLRATLVPAQGTAAHDSRKTVMAEATARALPRLIAGLTYTYELDYVGATPKTEEVRRIERELPDGTKVSFDTTVTTQRAQVDSVKASWKWRSLVGISTPVWLGLRRLSMTVAADIQNLERDWYAGFSFLRAAGGLETEGLPVDVHFLLHVGRIKELNDAVACRNDGECTTEDRIRFRGAGVSFSINAGELLADVIKSLGT